MTTPTPTDPLIGTTVSQYEIVAKLGGGGMGVVYKARDTKLGRAVALKFLPPQWSHDESAKQRFVREAQAASATNHRNICVIHNIEETADGRLFIVMAHYEGETLKQKLERGALPIAEAIEIGSEIAEGLARAHAQGVVHRDVKPGNLMITDDGVKILDFGLAKFADALQLTVPGSTIGTVAYMSPEQARGEEADTRSDVWALGVVLYEMLAGSVPFRGSYPEAIFHAIKNEPVPSLRAARPDTPEPLERIVMKALEKDPEKRFQTAREPARDLKLLAGRTVPLDLRTGEVVRPAGLYSGWPGEPSRRRRVVTPARLAVIAALLLTIAGGTYFWMTRPVERIRVAVVPVINQTGFTELDPYRLALTHALTLQLGDSTRIWVPRYDRLLQTIRRFLTNNVDVSSREAVQAITTESGAKLVIIPTLIYENKAWRARGEVRDAETATNLIVVETEPVVSSLTRNTGYELIASMAAGLEKYFASSGPRKLRWLESIRSVTGRRSPPIAPRFRTLDAAGAFETGLNKYEQLEYDAARASFEQAVKLDAKAPLGFAWLSRVLLILQQRDAAQQAGAQAGRLIDLQTPAGESLFVAAVDAESRRDYAVAEARYRETIDHFPDDASSLTELAAFQDRRNRSADAVTTYRRALALDSRLPAAHLELCRLYGRVNEPATAKQEGDVALESFRALGNRLGEALSLMCLTNVLRLGDAKSQADARQNAETAVRILQGLDAPYNLARAQYYVALAAESRGPAVAEPLYEDALAKARASGNVVLEPLVLMNLGAMNVYLGKQARALTYHEASRALFERFGDERRAAQLQSNIGSILIEYAGKPEEGLRNIENAKEIFRKLGDKDFEVFAAQMTAKSSRYAGRLADAERELNAAMALSSERDLTRWQPLLTIDLARIRFEIGDYSKARTLLIQALGDGSGKDSATALINLGRVYSHLGDFSAAQSSLAQASSEVAKSGMMWLLPDLHLALGELAYEMGRLSEAAGQFERASALWVDDLPETASVEARAFLGLLDALSGKTSRGRVAAESSLSQAKKIGSYWLEGRSALFLARIYAIDRDDRHALELLRSLTPDSETRVLGAELQAQASFWRARIGKNPEDPDFSTAKTLIENMRLGMPEQFRQGFALRPDIKVIVDYRVRQAAK